jgi:hypothetical protein
VSIILVHAGTAERNVRAQLAEQTTRASDSLRASDSEGEGLSLSLRAATPCASLD